MVHAFYAAMGGFAVDINSSQGRFTRDYTPRLSLTGRGALLLLQCGHLPYLSKESIMDRSKADRVAKTLTCMQALWFLIEFIVRYACHLPITLLELLTFSHTLCAVLIYIFWWSKPLDIGHPILLSGDWVEPLLSYMWMSSNISRGVQSRYRYDQELSYVQYFAHERGLDNSREDTTREDSIWIHAGCPVPGTNFSLALWGRREVRIEYAQKTKRYLDNRPRKHTLRTVKLTPIDVRRWTFASEAVSRYPAVAKRFSYAVGTRSIVEDLVAEEIPNWPGDDDQGVISRAMLTLATAAYGGLYAISWNGFFPSDFERGAWRISLLVIASTGGMGVIYSAAKSLDLPFLNNRLLRFLFDIFKPSILVSVGMVYIASRTFLVVDAFISLRVLPVDVYKTPMWTQFLPLPHF
jgi:hypothetical protein